MIMGCMKNCGRTIAGHFMVKIKREAECERSCCIGNILAYAHPEIDGEVRLIDELLVVFFLIDERDS